MSMIVRGGSIRGARPENEDAYVILDRGAGLFDGVGGHPNGAAAARAAADGLAAALDQTSPLEALQMTVMATGGLTTATVVRWASPIDVWTTGDSTAFHVGDELHRLTPVDGAGRFLRQCLGMPFQAHHATVRLREGEHLLLCTDGVSDTLDPSELFRLANLAPQAAVDAILGAVADAGAPDNATVIVASR